MKQLSPPASHESVPSEDNAILLKGVRVNNLKNIDLAIPRGKLVVVTGVSGSGKSSLAFDTLYAEGQRRYVESLSAYARQFLGRMSKPEADYIKGIPPAIAIEQRVVSRNPRSTVGTSTEVYEYLRLLFARIGRTVSAQTGLEIKKESPADVAQYVLSHEEGSRCYLLVPLAVPRGRAASQHLEILMQQGYTRLMAADEMIRIADYLETKQGQRARPKVTDLRLVIDRLVVRADEDLIETRLADSAETAFFEGHGTCIVRIDTPEDGATSIERTFSNSFEEDGITYREPTPQLFSFNNPLGACSTCEGFGKVMGVDESLVIPDKTRSVYDNAVACWIGPKSRLWAEAFMSQAKAYDFPIHRPYKDLTAAERHLLWHGRKAEGEQPEVEGIDDYFAMLARDMHKIQNRVRMAHFKGKTICPSCHGSRLASDVLCIRVGGLNIAEVTSMTIDEASAFFESLSLSKTQAFIARRLLTEIRQRLSVLREVGLGYLTLDRLSASLSGGESQRISLSTQLGSNLVGSLYVLDEPSIGLHQRDTKRLLGVLYRLRDLGNTVLVVEHDEDMMRAADFIIDIGPEAGNLGGHVVYAGDAAAIDSDTPGYTAAYLTRQERISVPKQRRASNHYIEVEGACKHNLKDINVRFPLHCLCLLTGVSGSGKSTLVRDLFYEGVRRKLEQTPVLGIGCRAIHGDLSMVKAVQYVDQNTIGRSTRSNPATYVGAYDDIRALYSEQPLSKQFGYPPYFFSFNKEGGRCEHCKGDGTITVEMQFMADIKLLCDECRGKRFRKEILEVAYHGKSIYDLLELTVDEAIAFFEAQPSTITNKIVRKLDTLRQVGLGYIKLGQNSSSLSGGENQRVKLAYYLGLGASEPTLFIFDEPTTGLHFHDIRTLLGAFNALIDKGHSIVVVEHNIEVIKSADYVIDLGPEGGAAGGYIVAQGSPQQIADCEESHTGHFLRTVMDL